MDHRLVLMHRDDKVCNLIFDDRGRLIKVVRTINPELLPFFFKLADNLKEGL